MQNTRNDSLSITATLLDLSSSLVQGTPENSGHFTPTVNDSIVDEDNTP